MKRFFILLVSVLFLSAIYSADKFDVLLGDLREEDTGSSSLPATTIINQLHQALSENSENANDSANQVYDGDLPDGTSKCTVFARATTIDRYTQLLLHLDNNVTDSSYNAVTINNTGVTFDGSAQKIGTHSGVWSSATITVPTNTAYNVASGNFTFEFYFKTSSSSDQYIFNRGANYYLRYVNGNRLGFYIETSDGNEYVYPRTSADLSISDGNWHHIAFVRSGSTYYIWVDGVNKFADLDSGTGTTVATNSTAWVFGQDSGGNNKLDGSLDEIRLSVGVARYTAPFTPATTAFNAGTWLTLTPASGKIIKKWTTGANHSILLTELGQTVELDRDSNGDWWPRLLIGSTPTEQAD